MPQQGYASTDPNFGKTPSAGTYASTDPNFGSAFTPPQQTTPAPQGFLDRLKAMSPRQWGATGIRALSGVLSSEGTFLGAGIGGLGEGLAQLVGGEEFNPAQIGTQAALSAIPLGRVFKGAASLAKDAGMVEKIMAGASRVGTNSARGAMLGAGQTAASDVFGEGRLPTAEELKFGAGLGAAGGAAASATFKGFGGKRGAPREPVPSTPRMSNEEATRALMGDFNVPVGVRQPATEREAQDLILGAQPTRGWDEVNRMIGEMPTDKATGSGFRPQERGALEADMLGDALRGQRSFDRETGQGSFGFGRMPAPPETGDSIDRLLALVRGERETPRVPEPAPVNNLTPDPWEQSVRDLTDDVPLSGEVPEGVTVGDRTDLGTPDEGYLKSFGQPAAKPVPEPIESLWKMLQPEWEQTLAKQEGDGIPFTVDPREDLQSFSDRVMSDDPRQLMGRERKVRQQIDTGGQEGFAAPGAMYYLGGAGAGAALGPLVDREDDPALAAAGGAGLGLLGVTAARNPQMLERLRFSNLFSGAAIPKSFLGNIGAVGSYMAEHPSRAGDVMSQLFDRRTGQAAVDAFHQGAQREFTAPHVGESIFDFPGKLIGAPDAAARNVLERAGASPQEAGQFTLSGAPSSEAGQWLTRGVSQFPMVRQILPVARTATNLIERGIERTPGLGQLPGVRAWSGASPQTALKRQGLGLLAMGASAGVGAASAPGGPLDDWGDAAPYANALMGPYALPGAVASVAGRAIARGGDLNDVMSQAGRELQNQLPLPSVYTNPFSAPGRYAGQFVPFGGVTRTLYPDYKSLDMNKSFFGPAAAQVPFLNESLLGHRAPTRPSLGFARRR